MFDTFIDYYLILIISLIVFYFAGSLILWLTKIKIVNFYSSLFCRLLIGVILFVVFSAIFFTKGLTIMIAFLFVGSFCLIELKSNKKNDIIIEKRSAVLNKLNFLVLFELFGIALLLYFTRYYFTFNLSGIPLDPHPDAVYYAKSAFYMVQAGVENCNFSFLPPNQNTTYPYHYFDLWVTGSLTKIFSTISLLTLLLVTYSCLTFIIYLGLCAIYEKFNVVTLFIKIICLLFIFFSGFIFFNIDLIPFFSNLHVFAVNAISYPKIQIIYVFLIASILCFNFNQIGFGFISLLCLPIVFISTAPSVLSAVTISSIAFLIFNKNEHFYKIGLRLLIYTILIGLLIASFYFFSGTKENSYHADAGSRLINQIQSLQYWRTTLNVIAGTVIQLSVLYFIPFLGMAIYLFRYNEHLKNLDLIIRIKLLLIVSLFVFSLGSWALLHDMVDSVQLFSNLSIPAFHLLIFVFGALIINRYKENVAIAGFILILIFYSAYKTFIHNRSPKTYSEKYLTAVKNAAKGINAVGVYIKSVNEYNSIFAKNSDFAVLGRYLSFIKSDFHPENISVFEIKVDSTNIAIARVEGNMVKNTAFYKFVQSQKASNEFKGVDESQVAFIDKYKIAYLIASKDAVVNPLIKPIIKEEITDDKTGERFILLN